MLHDRRGHPAGHLQPIGAVAGQLELRFQARQGCKARRFDDGLPDRLVGNEIEPAPGFGNLGGGDRNVHAGAAGGLVGGVSWLRYRQSDPGNRRLASAPRLLVPMRRLASRI